MFTAKA